MKSVEREPSTIMLVREETCPKISERASGLLRYRVCIVADESEVFLTIIGNETSGYYSRENVPLSRIKVVMVDAMSGAQSFPASRLKTAFEGRSANNASFMAAILRNEGLIAASPENPLLNIPGTSIAEWKKAVAALPRSIIAANTSISSATTETGKQDAPSKSKKAGKKKAKAVPEPAAGPEWVEARAEEPTTLPEEGEDALPQESE